MNIPETILNALTDEQKEKIKAANSPAELLAIVKEFGLELTDEQLEGLAGGTGPLGDWRTGPLGETGPLGTGPLGETGPLGTGPLGTGPLGTGPLGAVGPVNSCDPAGAVGPVNSCDPAKK